MNFEELFGMIFALLVLCIIFGSIFGFPVLKERIRLKKRELELRGEGLNDAQDLIDQISRLEERIRVLERIVTDDKSELRRQFRDLGT
jgi:ABC-type phosphate transport system auxiliary subunit